MTIPRPGVEPQEPPAYLKTFDGGEKFQQVADKLARWYETHRFLADAIPITPCPSAPTTSRPTWART